MERKGFQRRPSVILDTDLSKFSRFMQGEEAACLNSETWETISKISMVSSR
jgi:hypothetical protein